jgi:hypothetical protein
VLLSRFAYECAVYGGLVAIVASAWVAIRHRERRVEPKLPPATTGRSFRRYLARIAPVIVLLALLGGEWALLTHAHDVIVIDPGPSARRAIEIGGESAVRKDGYGPTLVINRSEHAVKFYRIDYDDYQVLHVVRPGTAESVPEVDFLGPDHQPPRAPGAEDRTWLTWD